MGASVIRLGRAVSTTEASGFTPPLSGREEGEPIPEDFRREHI